MGEGLITTEAYQMVLDELFLEAPEDELLLALEWTSDQREARKLILRQSSAPDVVLDKDVFARFLGLFMGRAKCTKVLPCGQSA